MTSRRAPAVPSATNASSAAGECTSSTSASPRRPSSRACPLPTASVLTCQPVARVNSGSSSSSRPESWVLVVVARISDFSADGPGRRGGAAGGEQDGGHQRHDQVHGSAASSTPSSRWSPEPRRRDRSPQEMGATSLASGRGRARRSRRRRPRRRPVLPDGTSQGRPGVARLDAAAPHHRPALPHRRRARRWSSPRPGRSCPSCRPGSRSWPTRSRARGRCGGWRRDWPRSATARRWPSCARPTCRSCTPRWSGGCCADSPIRDGGRRAAGGARLPAAAGRGLPDVAGRAGGEAAGRGRPAAGDAVPALPGRPARRRCAAGRPRAGAARPGAWTRWSTSTSPTTTRPPSPARSPRSWSSGSGRWRAAGSAGRAPSARPPSAPPPPAVGITLDRHVVAAVNGDQMTRDARLPLVAGRHGRLPVGRRRRLSGHTLGTCQPVGTSDGPWSSTSGTARRRARRCPSTTPCCAPTWAGSGSAPGCCTGWPRPGSTRWPRTRRWRSCSPRWSARR